MAGEKLRDKLEDLQSFPLETRSLGDETTRSGAMRASPLSQTVDGALREILGYRLKPSDPKGFVTALGQAFTSSEVDGRTEWSWAPRSYAVQAEMGAVTGAQASIYTRARAALDQSLPLLEGLTPLLPDADLQGTEAVCEIVRSELTELVNELGVVGGPRLQRVDAFFISLRGAVPPSAKPEQVAGLLGLMRERFGFQRGRVNTVEEEQSLTNYLILVDHLSGLHQSWLSIRDFFGQAGTDVFLGTQLVLLNRALAVIAESVEETYAAMDAVYLGPAEREITVLDFDAKRIELEVSDDELPFARGQLTVAELLSWVASFASEEAPPLTRGAGKDGVIALRPTLARLTDLTTLASMIADGSPDNPTRAYHSARSRRALRETRAHLTTALRLFGQLQRVTVPHVTSIDPETVAADSAPGESTLITLRGASFQQGINVYLTLEEQRVAQGPPIGPAYIRAELATVALSTEVRAFFDLSSAADLSRVAPQEKWTIVVVNPDGGTGTLPKALTITSDPAGSLDPGSSAKRTGK